MRWKRPSLKISTRVKHGCCYRMKSGPRRGRMCGEPVCTIGPSDYCTEHTMKVEHDAATKYLSSQAANAAGEDDGN